MESVNHIVAIHVNETSWAHVWMLRFCYLGAEYDMLASCIAAKVLHRPAMSVDHCHHRGTIVIPVTTPRAAPLLSPSLLAPRAALSILQLPSPTPHRHHVLACPCMPCGHHQRPPVQLTSSPTAYAQMPSTSPPRKAATTATSLLRLAVRACTPIGLPPR
jgi:hypothetical protein